MSDLHEQYSELVLDSNGYTVADAQRDLDKLKGLHVLTIAQDVQAAVLGEIESDLYGDPWQEGATAKYLTWLLMRRYQE